ncbi:MAG TPA: hypothetical protein VF595_16130 [Tepidisphaeraceae bacterium]|jgi:hypothetical protein
MAATMTRNAPAKVGEPKKEPKPGVAEATFPVRMLNAVGVAFNQDTRFAMSTLRILSKKGNGKAKADQISIVGTDGRRMVIVTHDKALFDGHVDAIIPGDVARAVLKIAAKSDAEEPTCTLVQRHNAFSLIFKTPSGEGRQSWSTDGETLPYPPFEDMIPDFSLFGKSDIGVSPDRMASTLKVVEKIVGRDHTAQLFLPDKPEKPLGLKATDGETVELLAVVMPAAISAWVKAPKEENAGDPDQQEMHTAWREAGVSELDISDAVEAKLNVAELTTIGQLIDYVTMAGSSVNSINGLTDAQAQKLDAAIDSYFTERKIQRPMKAATPEEKARDEAQESLMEYLNQRFISVGVPQDVHQDNTTGEKMDEAILAKVMSPAQAKDPRKAFSSSKGTTDDVKAWHTSLKGLKDSDYLAAAKAAGFDPKAGGRKTTLPS